MSATGRSTNRASTPPRPSSPRAPRRAKRKRVCANPECPVHHPKKQQPADQHRCCIQGRAGKAPPRGSAGPGHRLACAQSHRRRGSRPADETRPAVSGGTAYGDAGRAAPVHSHPATWHRQAQGRCEPQRNCWPHFCPRPRKASWAASWWRRPFSCPCTTRPTRQRFSAMPPMPTRWTWTPSPRQSSRSSRRRRRGKANKKATPTVSIQNPAKRAAA